MTRLQSDAINALGFCGICVLILLLGEFVRRAKPSYPELGRKTVHFLSGITALSLPYLIESHWVVLFFALTFSVIVILTRSRGMLRSVHDVGRKTYGDLYFPIAVYIIFLFGHDKPVLYLISILVMTVSDTLAALLGEKYGFIKYDVEKTVKSLEGSVVFFFVTFLCVHLPLLLMTSINKLSSVVIALVIALLVTGFEAISATGSDNIFVPFGTYYYLSKMTPQTLAANGEDLWKLLIMIAITIPISLKGKFFKTSGLIGMVLLNYGAWVLCDFYWLLPLLLAQILLYLLARYFVQRISEKITGHQIMVLVYSAIVPTIAIFAANTIHNQNIFYLSYLTSIICQIAVAGYYLFSIRMDDDNQFFATMKTSSVVRALICGMASTLFIALAPILFYWNKTKFGSLGIVTGGVWFSLYVFERLSVKYKLSENRILRQKMRLASSAFATVFVFIVHLLLIGE